MVADFRPTYQEDGLLHAPTRHRPQTSTQPGLAAEAATPDQGPEEGRHDEWKAKQLFIFPLYVRLSLTAATF